MYCTNCGKRIDDKASFCTYCGARVRVGAAAASSAAPAEQTPPAPAAQETPAPEPEESKEAERTENAGTFPVPPPQAAQTAPPAEQTPSAPPPQAAPTAPKPAAFTAPPREAPPAAPQSAAKPTKPQKPPKPPKPPKAPKTPAEAGRRRLLIVLGVLLALLLALLGALVYLLVRPAPSKTAGKKTEASAVSEAAAPEATPTAQPTPTPEPEDKAASVQAFPVLPAPTATPEPTPLLTDAERDTMQENLRTAQSLAQQGDFAGAVQLFQTVSDTAVDRYPAADTFTEPEADDVLYCSTTRTAGGTEQDDELCVSCIAVYDSDGNLSALISYRYAENCLIAMRAYGPGDLYLYYYEYTFDENGRLVKRFADQHIDEATARQRTTYTYDDAGNLVLEEYDYNDTNQMFTTAYTYDASGNRLTESFFNPEINSGYEKTYTYDSVGRLIKESEQWANGDPSVTTYSYNSNGVVAEEVYYCDGEYASSYSYTYKYNAAGNIVRKYISTNGSSEYATDDEYLYDADGHELSWNEYYKDGSSWVMETKTWENGRLTTNSSPKFETLVFCYAPKELLVSIGEQEGLGDSLYF